MKEFLDEIERQENSRRVALTKKYPRLLPLVLGVKRAWGRSRYLLDPRFSLRHAYGNQPGWSALTAHASPIHRTFTTVELDEGKKENMRLAIRGLDGLVIEPHKIFWDVLINSVHTAVAHH